ncbi:hypothetical protein DL96DRAFT_1602995 [Flagelloscypha sp. PMI_526]|nr:hypothetical protein DL96DRAFT_1602995 [Flagelloscypha sp. PMI_526]
MSNPSHILIARNSRAKNPAASLSTPTETHAAAAGTVFRTSGSPPWHLEECEEDVSELSISDDDETIEIHESFTRQSHFPGTVKIVVESTAFWAHKEVLVFASPFFEAALSGNWAETGRPPSMSSVITISQPPSVPGQRSSRETEMTFAPLEPETDQDDSGADTDDSARSNPTSESEASDTDNPAGKVAAKEKAREDSLAKLESASSSPTTSLSLPITTSPSKKAQARIKRRPRNGPDAVIVLKEERAGTFHDFLKFVYPHLDCTITWNNVEGLMNIAHKLCVTSLQQKCLTFLLTHAAGKPIKALRIAELFEEEDLYREASRFVLDNPGGWSEHELNTLSQDTLLKLEKRRNWFLERVLKLGLVSFAKEYACCSTCPDSANCARILDEKFRQAYHAVFRFGPPQPSMVFRYLRTLEGVSPPLSLLHLNCQNSAKAFTATLFDRMFSLGVRGSGTEALSAAVATSAAMTGPRRHFLYCSLKNDTTGAKARKSKDFTNGVPT